MFLVCDNGMPKLNSLCRNMEVEAVNVLFQRITIIRIKSSKIRNIRKIACGHGLVPNL